MSDAPEEAAIAPDVHLLGAACRNALELMATAPQSLQHVSVRIGTVAVELQWSPAGPDGHPGPATARPAEPEPAAAGQQATHVLASPMVGTFYHGPQPGSAPFVREGDLVQAGQQVAIIEAMKLMTPVEADRPGRVEAVLVPDGDGVEYGTPLLAITAS
ncbi:acetyl-CoA carboxylase biotin carboxyl carrier protein [Actinoplanes sp. NPDC004185]